MFHQSGGCCDGSAPMCYPRSEFIVGDADVLLGVLCDEPRADEVAAGSDGFGDAETPVWISGSQFALWKHTQLLIDVVPGRAVPGTFPATTAQPDRTPDCGSGTAPLPVLPR